MIPERNIFLIVLLEMSLSAIKFAHESSISEPLKSRYSSARLRVISTLISPGKDSMPLCFIIKRMKNGGEITLAL